MTPPDVPVCTALPSPAYPKMREMFLSLCKEDFACKKDLAKWQSQFSRWSTPTDHGWCTYTIKNEEFFVDENNPFPIPDEKGNRMKWKDVVTKSLVIPAKSVSKIKGYILDMCKKNNQCSADLQKWERKTAAIDSKLGETK